MIRHRSFIVAHLLVGVLGVALLPVLTALSLVTRLEDVVALTWLSAPLFVALYLVRTGRFLTAHMLASMSFISLVSYVAWLSGGLGSIALGWLILPQIEAGLTGNRRLMLGNLAMALAAVAFLSVSAAFPEWHNGATLHVGSWVLLAGAASSIVYTVCITLGMDALLRQAHQSTFTQERRYRLMAENASDLITRHSRNGNVLFASPSAQRLTHEEAATLLNDGMFQRVHVLDRPAFLRSFAQAVSSAEPVMVEFRLRREQGASVPPSWTWVEMNCRPLNALEADGTIEIIAVTRDIDQRKAHDLGLAQANEEIAKANAAKTRFLANVSHELRTPLNAIIGFSEMITYDVDNRLGIDRYREYAALIHDSGRHLLDVVNGILDMSKIESGSFDIVSEPFDVVPLISNCVDLMRPAAQKNGVEVVTQTPIKAVELAADRRACKQILLNLISNAIKFSPQGGVVTAGVRFESKYAVLFVSDTGIGISERDVALLGTPFVQADNNRGRKYEGTGLGLSLVKGLASLQGGTLDIRSTLGKGTTVSVRLPLHELESTPTNILPITSQSEASSSVDLESQSLHVRSA